MKKFVTLFFGSLLLSIFMIGCGESPESLSKKVNKSIDKEDYAAAYALVDPYFERHEDTELRNISYFLNEKILKHEIATLVGSDNNGDNAAKINFAIMERAKFNSFESCRDRGEEESQKYGMKQYAASLAETAGNNVLADKLRQ